MKGGTGTKVVQIQDGVDKRSMKEAAVKGSREGRPSSRGAVQRRDSRERERRCNPGKRSQSREEDCHRGSSGAHRPPREMLCICVLTGRGWPVNFLDLSLPCSSKCLKSSL